MCQELNRSLAGSLPLGTGRQGDPNVRCTAALWLRVLARPGLMPQATKLCHPAGSHTSSVRTNGFRFHWLAYGG